MKTNKEITQYFTRVRGEAIAKGVIEGYSDEHIRQAVKRLNHYEQLAKNQNRE